MNLIITRDVPRKYSSPAVIGSSFAHYMIYVNGKFVKDVYSFEELQQYYDICFLYGKITHQKV